MCTRSPWRLLMPLAICALWPLLAPAQPPSTPLPKPSVVFKVQAANERLDMTVRTSRILTMEQKIPQAQVNNPDILELTPLSPTQIQVSAKTAGTTQINLWGEDQKLYTVDVIVFGDARELQMVLRSTFPNAALKVTPVANSIMISGFVEQAEHIARIVRIAEEYYPKVINNMTVGGCQQVLLHVKIMEVSRTKLRNLGFDWADINGSNMLMSGVSKLILPPSSPTLPAGIGGQTPPAPATTSNNPINSTVAFNVSQGSSAFFGVLDALREDDLAKILAEPNLTTISGRPASFRAGGSFYIIPNGQNGGPPLTVQYGTQLDFVPIVLGNGKIHLDVRSIISEPDPSQPSQFQPAIKDRSAETGTELQAGQTLAIAGLVQSRTEAQNRGLPWISEVPYLGMLFRRVHEQVNEVELLILVTPELVEGMDACEVPPCGPGLQTTSPSDWELFMKGHLEVPKCCPTGNGACPQNGNGHDGPPPDGMILGPGEKIPTPPPADAAGRAMRPVRNGPNMPAQDLSAEGSKPSGPNNRYTPSKPTDPPGFIGPVGYDVVK
jgi:pilus assembly protein CpaC